MPPEGFQIVLGLGQFSKEERDMPGAKPAFRSPRFAPLPGRPQQTRHHQCNLFRLHARGRCRIQFAVVFRCDQPEFHPGIRELTRSIGLHRQRNVRRLNGRLRHQEPVKYAVDQIQHLRMAAKVGREFAAQRSAAFQPSDDVVERFDIGPTKGIDRLLGVTDDEQFSRLKLRLTPGTSLCAGALRQIEHNLVLHRVGILKFIDQQRTIVPFQLFTYGRMIAKQSPGLADQAVEGEPAGIQERLPNRLHERREQSQQILQEFMIDPEQPCGDPLQ